jgi:hypothetical protein
VRLEWLDKLKKVSGLIGTRTRDLPACSIVPQPNTLRRPPWSVTLGSKARGTAAPYPGAMQCCTAHGSSDLTHYLQPLRGTFYSNKCLQTSLLFKLYCPFFQGRSSRESFLRSHLMTSYSRIFKQLNSLSLLFIKQNLAAFWSVGKFRIGISAGLLTTLRETFASIWASLGLQVRHSTFMIIFPTWKPLNRQWIDPRNPESAKGLLRGQAALNTSTLSDESEVTLPLPWDVTHPLYCQSTKADTGIWPRSLFVGCHPFLPMFSKAETSGWSNDLNLGFSQRWLRVLEDGKSRVRDLIRWMNFSIYVILPATLDRGVYSACKRNEYQEQKSNVSEK